MNVGAKSFLGFLSYLKSKNLEDQSKQKFVSEIEAWNTSQSVSDVRYFRVPK
jgi:hypothetical protein